MFVDDETHADLVLTLSESDTGQRTRAGYPGVAVASESEQKAWVLTVIAPGSPTVLHGDRETIGTFNDLGGLKNLVRRMRDLIDGAASNQAPTPALPQRSVARDAAALPAVPCKVFLTEEKVSPTWYDSIRDVNYSRRWYGSSDVAFQALADQAWDVDADAVVAIMINFKPTFWAWASPRASGVAVKWNDAGVRNFAALKGRCFAKSPEVK